jgi:hypothetical protein
MIASDSDSDVTDKHPLVGSKPTHPTPGNYVCGQALLACAANVRCFRCPAMAQSFPTRTAPARRPAWKHLSQEGLRPGTRPRGPESRPRRQMVFTGGLADLVIIFMMAIVFQTSTAFDSRLRQLVLFMVSS